MKRALLAVVIACASAILIAASCNFSAVMENPAQLYAHTNSDNVAATLNQGDKIDVLRCIDTGSDLYYLVSSDGKAGYLYEPSKAKFDPTLGRPSWRAMERNVRNPIDALTCLAMIARYR